MRHLILILSFLSGSHVIGADYGYKLYSDEVFSIWWTNNSFRVMQQDLPSYPRQGISISAARNENESFIVVLRPRVRIDDLRFEILPILDEEGIELDGINSEIREMVYVRVKKVASESGKPGNYPDALPPVKGALQVIPGQNHPFWFNFKVGDGVAPGNYHGSVRFFCDGWEHIEEFSIRVYSFAIPKISTLKTECGIWEADLMPYYHLQTTEQKEKMWNMHFDALQQRHLQTSPFHFSPIRLTFKGLNWIDGGEYEREGVFEGIYSLKLSDHSHSANTEVETKDFIAVSDTVSYMLTWMQKSIEENNHRYTTLVKCYNYEKEYLPYENIIGANRADTAWRSDTLIIKNMSSEVEYIKIMLLPAYRNSVATGTMLFDNVKMVPKGGVQKNMVEGGDFEVDLELLEISLDFTEFDRVGKKYIDGLGYNVFPVQLEGLPSGSYYGLTEGVFHGFHQGTVEYKKLMNDYIGRVQEHLDEMGWSEEAYMRCFDEPQKKFYEDVKEGMKILFTGAPRVKKMITEGSPGEDIKEIADISCIIWSGVDTAQIAKNLNKGIEYWSYLSCACIAPHITEAIEDPVINMRLWSWMSYQYGLNGLHMWTTSYWNSPSASPKGTYQDRWNDPMSYMGGYGIADGSVYFWGNGEGALFYPPRIDPNKYHDPILDAPIPSVRLEMLAEGVEDYEYFKILEELIAGEKNKQRANKFKHLLDFGDAFFTDLTHYNTNASVYFQRRAEIADAIEEMLR